MSLTTTTWSAEQPVFAGWYIASTCEPRTENFSRYWNGHLWSSPIHSDDIEDPIRLAHARKTPGETRDDIGWRGIDVQALEIQALVGLAEAYMSAGVDDHREPLQALAHVLNAQSKVLNAQLREAAIDYHRRAGSQVSERMPKWLRVALQREPLTA